MQKGIDKGTLKELCDALLDAVWIQWRSLGTSVNARRLSNSMVDPEALILMSLTLRDNERRLWNVMGSWARKGSKLFSIQRVKNLALLFPPIAQERLGEFAYRARYEGKDHRWKGLLGTNAGPGVRSQELRDAYPKEWHPAALTLRLRLGFGIGITSDLLALLLAQNGEWINTTSIAQAIDYSPFAVRRAAEGMTAAGLIETTGRKPFRYRVNISPWCELLAMDGGVPEWCHWKGVYSFCASLISEFGEGNNEDRSAYLLSSELRDLVEEHEDTFRLIKIDYPEPQEHIGEDYLGAINAFLLDLAKWIRETV